MSYQKMKEISTLAREKGIEIKTVSQFAKFAKGCNNEN
jgi:hypothetical protein